MGSKQKGAFDKDFPDVVYYSLSLSDLILVDGFKKAWEDEDEDTIKKILFQNGMDTSKGFDLRYCEHRNLRGKVVEDVRFEAKERLDREWINSGCSSLDAIIATEKDSYVRQEMNNSRREGFSPDMYERMVEKAEKSGRI